jgi:hypothetical protein
MANQTSHLGIMGGLAKGRTSGASGNRATNKLVIPRGAVKGLAYMKMHGILSRNPQGSGGVGKTVKSKPCNCKGLGKTEVGGGGLPVLGGTPNSICPGWTCDEGQTVRNNCGGGACPADGVCAEYHPGVTPVLESCKCWCDGPSVGPVLGGTPPPVPPGPPPPVPPGPCSRWWRGTCVGPGPPPGPGPPSHIDGCQDACLKEFGAKSGGSGDGGTELVNEVCTDYLSSLAHCGTGPGYAEVNTSIDCTQWSEKKCTCPDQCLERNGAKSGGSGDGGTELVNGVCTDYLSSLGYCGISDSYKTWGSITRCTGWLEGGVCGI